MVTPDFAQFSLEGPFESGLSRLDLDHQAILLRLIYRAAYDHVLERVHELEHTPVLYLEPATSWLEWGKIVTERAGLTGHRLKTVARALDAAVAAGILNPIVTPCVTTDGPVGADRTPPTLYQLMTNSRLSHELVMTFCPPEVVTFADPWLYIEPHAKSRAGARLRQRRTRARHRPESHNVRQDVSHLETINKELELQPPPNPPEGDGGGGGFSEPDEENEAEPPDPPTGMTPEEFWRVLGRLLPIVDAKARNTYADDLEAILQRFSKTPRDRIHGYLYEIAEDMTEGLASGEIRSPVGKFFSDLRALVTQKLAQRRTEPKILTLTAEQRVDLARQQRQ